MEARILCTSLHGARLYEVSPLVGRVSLTQCTSGCGRPRVARARAKLDDEKAGSKGQQLWRKELQSADELGFFDSEKLFDSENSAIEKDIERLTKKKEVERILNSPLGSVKLKETENSGGLLKLAEKLLVADFFFILAILAWLVAAVVEESFFDTTKLIDAWLPLWTPLFQPALGVFMAGAIVSAVNRKQDQ